MSVLNKGDKVYLSGFQYLHKWTHNDQEYSQMKIDTNVLCPYMPDLQALSFKPRKGKKNEPHDAEDSDHDFNQSACETEYSM